MLLPVLGPLFQKSDLSWAKTAEFTASLLKSHAAQRSEPPLRGAVRIRSRRSSMRRASPTTNYDRRDTRTRWNQPSLFYNLFVVARLKISSASAADKTDRSRSSAAMACTAGQYSLTKARAACSNSPMRRWQSESRWAIKE